MTRGTSADAPARTVNVGWFVLVVAASGLISFVQAQVGSSVQIQIGARLLLVVVAILAAVSIRNRGAARLTKNIRVSMVMFLASALATVAVQLFAGTSVAEIWPSFLFMYGIGFLVVVFLIAPVSISTVHGFRWFCIVAVAFGVLQAIRQDLMLPIAVKDEFGIVYEDFLNGRVRVLSFFASAPRFAELLVFVAAVLQVPLIAGRRLKLGWLIAVLAVLFALFNTFSRSGYLLLATVTIVQLVTAKSANGDSGRSSSRRALIGVAIITALLFVLQGAIQIKDGAITDSSSFEARRVAWKGLVERIHTASTLQFFVGRGESARFAVGTHEYFVVDNLYLALFTFGGLLGLAAFLILYVNVLARAYVVYRTSTNPVLGPLFALGVAALLEGLTLDNHNTISLIMFTLIGVLAYEEASGAEPRSIDTVRPGSRSGAGLVPSRGAVDLRSSVSRHHQR